MRAEVTIDNITIRLPSGWHGDRVHLARRVAEQLQHEAADLSNVNEFSLRISGHFGASANRVAEQVLRKLQQNSHDSKPGGGPQR